MSLPKWTPERTTQLSTLADGASNPVTLDEVAEFATTLETSTRSVASKLRKMGFDVELAGDRVAAKAYTAEEEAALRDLVVNNSGVLTYAELASEFAGGKFSAKSVQGKILSMELTSHIKPTPKVESVKTYTEAEEATFVSMANGGSSIEDIAAALGKEINSVRGKALSLLRGEQITAIPHQANKAAPKEDLLAKFTEIATMTVEQLAEATGKTARGIKTMLTKRGIKVADYDGAARKAKAAS